MAERPLIAIPARFSQSASALRSRADVTSRALLELVYAAGGEPLVVHPSAPGGLISDTEVAERLSWAAGVLLPGGGDMSGQWSGQGEHPALYDVDVEQDAFDLAVARVTMTRRLPLFAICRGLQVVNVALGGTLVQDMESHGGAMANHRHHRHTVTTRPDTLVRELVGENVHASCYHHQCVDEVSGAFEITARAEDGVIEAMELPQYGGWFLGVQWHPEVTWADDPRQLAMEPVPTAVAGRP